MLAASGSASAGIIPTLSSVTLIAPGVYRYRYAVDLTAFTKLDPARDPAFVTIYDFDGFIPGSQSATGGLGASFLASSALSGPNAQWTVPADDPTVANLTWTYAGGAVGGSAFLGYFSADSTFGTIRLDSYTSQATTDTPGRRTDNTPSSNIGSIAVPQWGPLSSTVPEAASLTLVGVGLLLVGVARAARRASRPPLT
jgi:hypothetical protein